MSQPAPRLMGVDSQTALDTLTRLCACEGIAVLETTLDSAWGAYDHNTRTIYLHAALTTRQKAATLAHEYVHYLRGDTGPQPPHVERRVDEEAAFMLISTEEYATAEHIVGPDPRALAIELDTTLWIVEAWQNRMKRQSHYVG